MLCRSEYGIRFNEARRGLQPRRLGFVCASMPAKLQNVMDGITNPVRMRRDHALPDYAASGSIRATDCNQFGARMLGMGNDVDMSPKSMQFDIQRFPELKYNRGVPIKLLTLMRNRKTMKFFTNYLMLKTLYVP